MLHEKMIVTEFKVNKEKRTVVCILVTVNDIPNRLEKYNLEDEEFDFVDFDIRKYVGVAKCSPEDEWDESYGRKLAEYRATRARQVDVNTELKKYINGVRKSIDALEKHGMLKTPHRPKDTDR